VEVAVEHEVVDDEEGIVNERDVFGVLDGRIAVAAEDGRDTYEGVAAAAAVDGCAKGAAAIDLVVRVLAALGRYDYCPSHSQPYKSSGYGSVAAVVDRQHTSSQLLSLGNIVDDAAAPNLARSSDQQQQKKKRAMRVWRGCRMMDEELRIHY